MGEPLISYNNLCVSFYNKGQYEKSTGLDYNI